MVCISHVSARPTKKKHRSLGLHADNLKRCPGGLHGEMVYCPSFYIKNSTSGSLATHELDIFLLALQEPAKEILICQATSLTSFIIFICKLQILIYVFSSSRTRNYTFINRRLDGGWKQAHEPLSIVSTFREKGMSTPDECSSRMNTNGLRITWRQRSTKTAEMLFQLFSRFLFIFRF